MSEWQPAIFRLVHKRHKPRPPEALHTGDRIFVREIEPWGSMEDDRRVTYLGCNGTKFYLRQDAYKWVCEHEILTD